MKNLLVISASNGENLKLAERFATAGTVQGLATEVLDLTTVPLPLFTPRQKQKEGFPSILPELIRQLDSAPQWVICSPEYNGSIPPVLTNAIAWLSVYGEDFRRLFNRRPIAIASHSGSGGYEILMALRVQLAHLGSHVVGRQLVSNAAKPAKDESIAAILQDLMQLSLS
jgi:NAD(P)H-dependent FMN reductase